MPHPTKPIGPFYSRAGGRRTQAPARVGDRRRRRPRLSPGRALARSGRDRRTGGDSRPGRARRAGHRLRRRRHSRRPRRDGSCVGVEAVIDKDRASALLAGHLGVDLFAISTDTDYVYLDYKKPDAARPHAQSPPPSSKQHFARRPLPPGQHGPENRICPALSAQGGRQEAIITSYEHLRRAVAGTRRHSHVPRWRDAAESDHDPGHCTSRGGR